MRKAATVAVLLLLCPTWRVLSQQSDKEWEPFQAQKAKPAPSGEPLTNDSIVKLVKIGFSEATITAMINNRPGKYSLEADDLVALKKAGVSEKIITAMLNKPPSGPPAPLLASEKVKRAKQRDDQSSQSDALPSPNGGDVPVPKDHGLYYQASNRLLPLEGQVVSFARSGSRLSSSVTFGLKSAKMNVQILGETSAHTTDSRPVFYYRAAQGTEAAGGSAGDLVLVKMTVKQKRRQFEIAAAGAWRSSQGISVRSQLQVTRKQIEPDLYRLAPAEELSSGEYALYLFRGYDLPGFIYDFSVE